MPQTLFDLLSLFYVFIGARVIWTVARNWRAFSDSHLTIMDRRLADQLAFFVLIPPGVFLHELGHALATMQVGGRVREFHFALFWGYVIPVGRFTPAQSWWIATSGNLVSIVYGMLALPLLFVVHASWQKYLLLSFARIQLIWSLIGYPLITFLGFEGDWKTIYDPRTWYLGVPFGFFHALLILGLWLLNRNPTIKRWELSLDAGVAERLHALDAQIAARPGDPNARIDRGNLFAQAGQAALARADYEHALKLDPENSRALYNLGQIELEKKNLRGAEQYFQRALSRALGNPQLASRAHFGIGMVLFERGARADAVREFDLAVQGGEELPDYYYWRGIAQRSLGQDVRARFDFARAAELADGRNPYLAAQARRMMAQT